MKHVKTVAIATAMLGVIGCGNDVPQYQVESHLSSNPPPQVQPAPQPEPAPASLQGFEVDTAGWTATQGITRVRSVGFPASAGDYYAALQNKPDGYPDAVGCGDAGYSFFGGKGTEYKGDFYQAIDVYVDAQWAPAAAAYGDSFWIDMTPHHADPANYGAEHNFHLRATGSQVDVRVDGQTEPIASITTSGWYTFLMTFEKGLTEDDPVVTRMKVLDATQATLGSAAVTATGFPSKDLLGNGYVWITVWQNGFAGDVLFIDNVNTALLPQPQVAVQGFEADTGDWNPAQGITRVASNAGTPAIPASAGDYYAELQNARDGYATGYGDAGYSFFGGKGTEYQGDFYQAIDVYVDASWAPAANAGVDGFWIDMTPYHADPANYGAEHNFHLRATGSQVEVRVDGETNPIATIAASGWYTFLMTFEKGAADTDPVVTRMIVQDAQHTTVGTAKVTATSPGGPFLSQDLKGNGYVWITVWQNGFAGDVLAIDNLKTGLLP